MCKENPITTKDVKSTWLSQKLKNFPKCGVRFGGDGNGHGYVLVSPNILERDRGLVREKIEAAKIKSGKSISILAIPVQLAKAAGL